MIPEEVLFNISLLFHLPPSCYHRIERGYSATMVTFPIVTHNQRTVLAVAITFAALPVIAVLLRLLAKRISHRSLDWSDFCVTLAAVGSTCRLTRDEEIKDCSWLILKFLPLHLSQSASQAFCMAELATVI